MPPLPDYDGLLGPRMGYLLRTAAMIEVGCCYAPNDLEPATWDHLLILASERAFVDRLVDKRREKSKEHGKVMSQARKVAGTPAPGGTLFKPSKPFKGPTK